MTSTKKILRTALLIGACVVVAGLVAGCDRHHHRRHRLSYDRGHVLQDRTYVSRADRHDDRRGDHGRRDRDRDHRDGRGRRGR